MALAGIIGGFVVLAVVVGLIAAKVFGLGPFAPDEKTDTANVTPPSATHTEPNTATATDPNAGQKKTSTPTASTKSTDKKKTAAPGARIVVWTENFESGLDDWSVVPGAKALTKGAARALSGTVSAKLSSTGERMYRDIGFELDGPAKLTFWMYDETANRAFCELRAYTRTGSTGTLRQSFAIGRYDVGFGTLGKGITANEVVDKTRYQGRVVYGENTGWFNLDAPGAPSRSEGWHKFEIERQADGTTIKFFVDGILGRAIPGATAVPLNSVEIGSLGAGNTEGIAWFDDIKLEYFGAPSSGADATTRWNPSMEATTDKKSKAKDVSQNAKPKK